MQQEKIKQVQDYEKLVKKKHKEVEARNSEKPKTYNERQNIKKKTEIQKDKTEQLQNYAVLLPKNKINNVV